ncbi:MAG: oxidoreductase [Acidobacteria bacterium]|nr:MAG: oxidoreductase [Acidobacteriota bacterium]
MGLTITQVDAFTDTPFAGNPAAVCVLPAPREEDWMRAVAREMNLSETAFLVPRADGYDLRWFTPAVEVDLCGHATLASAHVLWETGQLAADAPAHFHTRSGLLTATKRGDWIELDFPARPVTELIAPPDEIMRAFDIEPVFVGRSKDDYLVEVADEETVRRVSPDFTLLKRAGMRGVIITARATTDGYDFVSRFFAPGAGIDEDPATGSAHCALGMYWQAQLKRDEFTAYQASARGGVVKVRVGGDRVYLNGQAVTVLRCELDERAL